MHRPVLAFVERLCAAPTNRFGTEFLAEHLLVVEQFALQLASALDADQTVVRIAALLHDVAALKDAALLPAHAERGGQMVMELFGPSGFLGVQVHLTGFQIDRIAKCVREHSSPKRIGETTAESVCVSNADAMSQIARPFYWFHYARTVRGLSHADALAWYLERIEGGWNAMNDVARRAVTSQYEAVRTLLRRDVPGSTPSS